MEQGFQLHRGQLRQLQRVLLLTVVQRLLHHLVAQTFRGFVNESCPRLPRPELACQLSHPASCA